MLAWESNRTAGSRATRWWASATQLAGTYHIESDPSWRTIYRVYYVGPDGSGTVNQTKIGSEYTVPDAKKLAQQHDQGTV